ncbi:MAG: exodeoxyribonuclease V subunit alpha [Propionibacteriaceae bacterium]|jgi:exodeoxyribonuclease V alpha subunit|nr:exodeoxyribonuclease V subunit alpha [Propionibacteriaceae bacterium]
MTPATLRLARHLGFLYGEADERVIAQAAATIQALAAGSVCCEVTDDETRLALTVSPMVATDPAARDRPLTLDGPRVYLTRYWAEQSAIVDWLTTRLPGGATGAETATTAARLAAAYPFCVIAGGPGTGKTTAVAGILAGLVTDRPLRVILTAPTGRAAARLEQAVREQLADSPRRALIRVESGTLHRILGLKPWGEADHDAGHPLPADVIIVDEASMLSLHLMALLLRAITPPTRLVLVGDPDQLASVDAGAVLADIASSDATIPVHRLTHTYRFRGDIARLADAIRRGDADQALAVLGAPAAEVQWLDSESADAAGPALQDEIVEQGLALIDAGRAGDAARALATLDSHRLLLAHRHGLAGVSHWTQTVRGWLAGPAGSYTLGAHWYAGMPVLITRNDDLLGVYNGDAGVIVQTAEGLALAVGDGPGVKYIPPDMLQAWEPLYASTIHKAQGSQYDAVTLVLPPPDTVMATRELLYTAVTRAKTRLRVIGSEAALRHAIASPALRASGLAAKLGELPRLLR